ncbi:MAG: CDP-alcohol phosphatidyltransferase family protein [candidate division Zixibacteria bacterium]|nr:CDP-alcohol phosphatidyltransferase family protein [candidate division Zixibacteria bacterium]
MTTEQETTQSLNQKKRAFYEERSLFLGRICVKMGLTPNVITVFSLLVSLMSGIFFWKAEMLLGVAFMLLTSFTDMLDGSTARAGNMGTLFGGMFDHVADRYGEFFILAGIALSGSVHAGWALAALFGMLIASYTRAAAESIGKMENCAVGIMGRLEKFIVIMVGASLESFYPTQRWLELALILVALTSLITAAQRLLYARKILGNRS